MSKQGYDVSREYARGIYTVDWEGIAKSDIPEESEDVELFTLFRDGKF